MRLQTYYLKNKKLIKFLLSSVIIFLTIKLFYILSIYSELFYAATFLPKQDLQVQTRRNSSNGAAEDLGQQSRLKYPKILCLITTSPKHHQIRAAHVAATWAKHCTVAIFLTSQNDSILPRTFVVPEAEGYNDLSSKVTKGFKMLMESNVMEEYNCDWVIKTDDDTFVIIENLRKALKPHNPNHLIAVGLPLLTWDTNETYLNGGAGYVLSKTAVQLLVQKGLNKQECQMFQQNKGEDVDICACLLHLGVSFFDLKDFRGRKKFHMYSPMEEMDPREVIAWKHLWLKLKSSGEYKFGFEDMSNRPISFHYVSAEWMYLLYYLIYVIHQ